MSPTITIMGRAYSTSHECCRVYISLLREGAPYILDASGSSLYRCLDNLSLHPGFKNVVTNVSQFLLTKWIMKTN